MLADPYVSIIIPTYNHAKLLKKALDSVVAQTFTKWEAIVVNNFSTDDTIEIVDAFNDSRIRIINFSNFGVIAASRNRGLRDATGGFIAFLDSDDIWYPDKLQKCVDQSLVGNQFISHGELWINRDLSQRPVMYGPVSRATYKNLLYRGNCISTSATFIETALINSVGGFDEDPKIVTTEDYDLWMRLAAKNPNTVFIPEILGEFHRLAESASSSVIRSLSSEIILLKKHFIAQPKTISNQLRMRHRFAIAHYGAARQLTEQPLQAVKQLIVAWKLSPLVLRIYPGLIIALFEAISKKKSGDERLGQ